MAAQVAANVNCEHDMNTQGQAGSEMDPNSMDFNTRTSPGTNDLPTENVPNVPETSTVGNRLKSPSNNEQVDFMTKGNNNNQDGGSGGGRDSTGRNMKGEQTGFDTRGEPYQMINNPNFDQNMPNQLMEGNRTMNSTLSSVSQAQFPNNYYASSVGNRNSYNMAEQTQHGGPGPGNMPQNMPPNPNMGQHSTSMGQYNQFDNTGNIRTGYPASSKAMGGVPSRTSSNMMSPYNTTPQQQQRYMGSGYAAGQAPTLSQLLQGQKPNLSQGFANMYPSQNEYSQGMGKGPEVSGMSGGPPYGQQWGNTQRTQHPHQNMASMGPNQGLNRPQMGMMMDMQKRPGYMMPNTNNPYQQQGQYGGRSYPSSTQQRYGMPGQHRSQQAPQNMPGQHNQYQQQQMPAAHYGQQGQQVGYSQQQHQQQAQQQQQQQQQQQGQPQQGQSPMMAGTHSRTQQSMMPSIPNQQEDLGMIQRPPSLPDLSGAIDDLPSGLEATQPIIPTSSASQTQPSSQSSSNDGFNTPVQSPHVHPSVSALRPSPSPVGSPASHISRSSMSPASVQGNPMTPQPPTQMPPPPSSSSSQNDTMSHTAAALSQSPMPAQQERPMERGYNQQMHGSMQLSPQMAGSPLSSYGSQGPKMSPTMQGPLPMSPYQQSTIPNAPPSSGYGQNVNPYDQQGNFPRQGMGGYNNQMNNFGTVSGNSGNIHGMAPPYGENRMRNQPPNNMGNMSYNASASGPMPPTQSGQNVMHHSSANMGMKPAMGQQFSPSSQRTDVTPNAVPAMGPNNIPSSMRGAQAAAQAAVMAAANTAQTKTVMYPRQPPPQYPQRTFPPSYQHQQWQQHQQTPQQGFPPNTVPPVTVKYETPNAMTLSTAAADNFGSNLSLQDTMPSNQSGPGFAITTTSTTQSISSPVTTSAVNNVSDQVKGSPVNVKDEPAEGAHPHQNKDDSASRPSSPPIGLLGASPLPSPDSGSKLSSQDDETQHSSPISNSLPRTPQSLPRTPQSPSSNKERPLELNDQVKKLYNICEDPERAQFLDKLVRFLEDKGEPIKKCPTISNTVLDLFKLYKAVKSKGGVTEVTKNKLWKEICAAVDIGSSNSAAFTLRKNYNKYLLAFECHFDMGGISPSEIFPLLETSKVKKERAAIAAEVQDPFRDELSQHSLSNSHGISGEVKRPPSQMNSEGVPTPTSQFTHHDYPRTPSVHSSSSLVNNMSPMPPGNITPSRMTPTNLPPTGMMGPMPNSNAILNNSMMPPRSSSNNSISVQDPFADDITTSNFPPQSMSFPNIPPSGGSGMQSSFNEGINRMSSMDPYANNSMPPTSDPYVSITNPPNSMNDPFTPGRNTQEGFPGRRPEMYRANSMDPFDSRRRMNQGPGSQFPYGNQYDRENSNQMGPEPYQPSQHGGVMPPFPPNSTDQSMYQSRYGPQPHPGHRPQTPHEGYGQSFPGQPPYQQQQPSGPQQSSYPQPFPQQKRPPQADMFSPAAKRQATGRHAINQEEGYPLPPYSQPGPMPQNTFSSAERSLPNHIPFSHNYRERPNQTPIPPQGPGHIMPPSSHEGPMSWNTRNDSQYPYSPRQGPMPGHRESIMMDPMRARDTHGPSPSWGTMHQKPPGGGHFGGDTLSHHGPSLPPYGPHLPHHLQSRSGQSAQREKMNKHLIKGHMHPSGFPSQQPQKKEISFPPNCVESTQSVLKNRKKLTSRDVGPVEAWRVMMCLKSGLLAESTWAIDTLNILLYDENTVAYFQLQHLPGLLEILIEHYRRCIIEIFGVLGDTEVKHTKKLGEGKSQIETNLCNEDMKVKTEEKICNDSEEEERELIDDALANINLEKYKGNDKNKSIKVEKDSKGFYSNEKSWDSFDGFEIRSTHWQLGGGDTTDHVIMNFETKNKEISSSNSNSKSCNDNKDSEYSKSKVHQRDFREELEVKIEEEVTLFRSQKIREDEAYDRDCPPFNVMTDYQDDLARRCVSVSNVLRSLSFIPGNDVEMSKHAGFLHVVGTLLLLHHHHPIRNRDVKPFEKDDMKEDPDQECPTLIRKDEWWWDCLNALRENTLVSLANIAGKLDLSVYLEHISFSLLDGLLHWAVCPSAYALDPLPTLPAGSPLSPMRLSLETLCKLCVLDNNVDMVLATPPFARLERLYKNLVQYLGDRREPVVREFAVVLLSTLSQGDSTACRAIACQKSSISLLLSFLEDGELAMNSHNRGLLAMSGIREELPQPSVDMMRRAATTLGCLAKISENKSLFLHHQSRLLALAMSSVLEPLIHSLISDVLLFLQS